LTQAEKPLNLTIGLIAVLGTGLLDFYENHYILTFILMPNNMKSSKNRTYLYMKQGKILLYKAFFKNRDFAQLLVLHRLWRRERLLEN
jgi:hypothetical protein